MIKGVLCATANIRNPKRGSESRVGRASWYAYYAGFSGNFVQDALQFAAPRPQARILDPWNGSGTTTEIAASLGFETFGFDLNPAMVIVAKSRLLDHTVQASLGGILDDLLNKERQTSYAEPDDPLTTWLTPSSAVAFRNFERAIQTLLIDPKKYQPLFSLPHLNNVSSLAAFFYVAAFRALRELLIPFRSANPTWIKQPEASERITVRETRLHKILREQASQMAASLNSPSPGALKPHASIIERAASASLPVSNRSVDVVISSPPYCTRIDYVNKTSPELALLGAKGADVKNLRGQMIGTPTVNRQTPQQAPMWGATCLDVLNAIFDHNSYASKSYYWKTYTQYFDGLHQSLREIDRALKRKGTCILVVQDSYFKDVHVDLAKITGEMARGLGWTNSARADFQTARTMVGLNTQARKNGNPRNATETVLAFRKFH